MNNTAQVLEHPSVSSARKATRKSVPPKPRKATQKASGIVFQVRQAFEPKNRLATLLGCLLGAFVPAASFTIAHYEISDARPWYQIGTWLVVGGLLYSATSVYQWGKLAFRSPVKAAGFVVLAEGILVFSSIQWLTIAALAYLCAINGISTGCNMVVKEEKTL